MKRWLPFVKSQPTVAVVRLNGMIASGNRRGALNDAGTAQTIERAFSRGKPDAVALVINSPGGSPVQSSLIAARIRRLAKEKGVKVYAFTEDVAASGGYWLACAGDEIWIDPSSVVGSIGVISASFGLHDFIARHGVERRVHTSGRSKSMLDPFRPENPDDVERLKGWQEQIHETFIDYVKDRRGSRLAEDPDMFTGNIWIGKKAVEVGLADGVGHVVPKMKEIFGDKVKLQAYGPKRGLLSRFGMTMAEDAIAAIEERGAYARFGL
ncbi:S49 family peptidase [Psychromarinibacter sp. S121]|uniref:S49 family peptidase n=1 Tax=Psychromarinibacter sp. S121 TaxID=3415127 RepID=UPI003C7AF2C4